MSTAATPPKNEPTSWLKTTLTALIPVAIVSLVVLAFLWPAYTAEPHGIDVDVVASEQSFAAFEEQAEQAAQAQGQEMPFELHRVDTREEAIDNIKHRDAYGAFVLPTEPGASLEALTAPAGDAAITGMITDTAQGMEKARIGQAIQQHPEMAPQLTGQALQGATITEVVPQSAGDPQGMGLKLAALPLTIGSIMGGALISLLIRGTWRRVWAVALYSTVAGSLLLAIIHNGFGFLPEANFAIWGALTLSLAATVSLITGLTHLIGKAGIGVGAVLTMLLGIPLSGTSLPSAFLPGSWGEIGQLFVPGATNTLIRDLTFFPEASTTHPWLVLSGWVAMGFAFLLLGHARKTKADGDSR
ncbi:ABC transporter permease [Corynebacterium tapiri]|uniref:ABC transporter permease n=1 Tax=Corynebacterium tapiri TaxID=1448266 RepID=A0A5C4U4Z2_9CORY|nr:ABC transporter permease [Corynebacterium tapiri]TNL99226.1 ABC transporter permease [Corynebacterium tapiri]